MSYLPPTTVFEKARVVDLLCPLMHCSCIPSPLQILEEVDVVGAQDQSDLTQTMIWMADRERVAPYLPFKPKEGEFLSLKMQVGSLCHMKHPSRHTISLLHPTHLALVCNGPCTSAGRWGGVLCWIPRDHGENGHCHRAQQHL
jgi:hypothetical protein